MKRIWKIGGLVAFGALCFGGGFAVIAPSLISGGEEKIQKKLAENGVEVSFQDRSIWGDTLTLKGVKIDTAKRQGSLSCAVDLVSVDIGVLSVLSGEVRADSVRVAGGSCDVKRANNEPSNEEKNSKSKPDPGQNIERLLSSIPTIIVENFKLSLQDEKRTDVLLIRKFSHDDGEIEGEVSIDARRQKLDLIVGGQVSSSEGTVSLTLSAKEGPIRLKQAMGTGEISSLMVDASYRPRVVTVAANEVNVDSLFGKAAAAKLEVSMADRPRIRIEQGTLNLSSTLLDFLNREEKTNTDDGEKTQTQKSNRSNGFSSLQIEIVDSALKLSKGDDQIEVTNGFSGSFKNGKFTGKGQSAGGEFQVDGQWVAGRKLPERVELRLSNIALAKIPGMPSGRSKMPNRGTSGKIDGLVSGSLLLTAQDSPKVYLDLNIEDGFLDFVGVSDNPIEKVSIATSATATIDRNLRWLDFTGSVRTAGIALELAGDLEGLPLAPVGRLTVKGAPESCQAYFNAVPKSIWGPYQKATWTGTMTPTVTFEYPKLSPLKTKFLFDGYQECEVSSLNSTKPAKVLVDGEKNDVDWLNRAFKKRVVEGVSEGTELYVGPGTANYVRLDSLPKHVGAAAYLSEQTKFYTEGNMVSFGLLQRAFRKNLEGGRFVYGGSTVAQQLVKNLFLVRDKTIARKLQEMIIAWRFRSVVSLDRILELYLNCIEFGYDIYGIEAASRHYFQKSARDLTPKESVFLAMLKPSPKEGERAKKKGYSPNYPWWIERQQVMFDRLVEHEVISPELAESEKPYDLTWEEGKYVRTPTAKVPILGLDELDAPTPTTPKPAPQ